MLPSHRRMVWIISGSMQRHTLDEPSQPSILASMTELIIWNWRAWLQSNNMARNQSARSTSQSLFLPSPMVMEDGSWPRQCNHRYKRLKVVSSRGCRASPLGTGWEAQSSVMTILQPKIRRVPLKMQKNAVLILTTEEKLKLKIFL